MRLIAEGGMSEVYEAVHVGLKKRVALKALGPQLAKDPDARARFIAEAEYASRIHHAHVVDVTDVGVVDGVPYLVMELLHGETLRGLYARKHRLPYRDLIDLLLPIAAAVTAGHEQRVIHRDLKPENIFLHRVGRRVHPKLLDFGVSSIMNARGAAGSSSIVGTTLYMSPEQARGDANLDVRTDQYALGVIIYEGLLGRLPSPALMAAAEPRPVELVPSQPPSPAVELPAELEAVILRALARDPDQRFASVRAFALALVPFANEPAREYWSLELAERGDTNSGSTPLPDGADGVSAPQPQHGAGRHEDTIVLMREPPPRRRSSQWAVVTIAALLAAALPWVLVRMESVGRARLASQESVETYDVEVHVTPALATLELDGKRVGAGHYLGRLPKDGASHELQISADGFVTHKLAFRDSPPPRRISLMATPEPRVGQIEEVFESEPNLETRAPNAARRSKLPVRPGARVHPKATDPALAPASSARLSLAPLNISAAAGPARPALTEDVSSSVVVEAGSTSSGEHHPKVRAIEEPLPQVQVIE